MRGRGRASHGHKEDASARTLTCRLGTLAAGDVRRVTLTGRMAPDLTGELRNDARVASDTADPNAANDTDAATTALSPASRLTVEKLADRPSVLAGGLVTFTITAHNAGLTGARRRRERPRSSTCSRPAWSWSRPPRRRGAAGRASSASSARSRPARTR
jgi:Domain of unknown function DUF11